MSTNKITRCFLLAWLCATPVLAHETHGQPQYGGIVAEAGLFQGELVVQDKTLTLYLSEHGKPLAASGATVKLTLLSSGKKSEHVFKPAGAARFEALLPAAPAPGSKGLVNVKLADQRTGNLRFSLP